jgi:signal peptidase II
MARKRNLLFWLVAIISIVCDRLTKVWIMHTFTLSQTLPVWPGVFHFTYVTNTGAAFSLFTQGSGWLRWFSLLVSFGIMVLVVWGPPTTRWEQAAYGFILGGAIGNGIDRFAYGTVIDFLDFRLINFPVFNVADVSINLGIVCWLIAALQQNPRNQLR